jgi:hypothetical protein
MWLPRAASTVYRVKYGAHGPVIDRMRINDKTYLLASNGEKNYQKNVAMAFRSRVKKDFGFDPGWIDYELLDFKDLATVAAQP